MSSHVSTSLRKWHTVLPGTSPLIPVPELDARPLHVEVWTNDRPGATVTNPSVGSLNKPLGKGSLFECRSLLPRSDILAGRGGYA